ncbi:MAG: permease [Phycisphaerae bacterium]
MGQEHDHQAHPADAAGGGGAVARFALAGRLLELAFVLLAASMLVFYRQFPHLRQQQVREVTRVFLGIVLEALPFMLLGSMVGGLIEVFVSTERLSAVLSRRRGRSVLVAAGMGLVFPVCECAIVPVVRRLVRKGVPLLAAVAYLLAGPIVNPIVAASTFVAYGGDWHMPLARAALGYVIAVTVGLTVSRLFGKQPALLPETQPSHGDGHHASCCEAHGRGGALGGRLLEAVSHAAADFLDVGRFLVIGAFVAAVLRTVVSQEQILSYGSRGPGSTLAMMSLAFVLNLCSEADAFVAASFRDVVAFSGQMAFLVLGPMLDVKLVMMYLGLFRKRAILALVILIPAAVFLATSIYGVLMEGVRLCILLVRSS